MEGWTRYANRKDIMEVSNMDLDQAVQPRIGYLCCWQLYARLRVKVIPSRSHFVTLRRPMIRSIESYSIPN